MMNLLTDPWIPVCSEGGGICKIPLKELLCKDDEWQVSLPRDDMEIAAVQLAISLTQSLFAPQNKQELKKRLSTPLETTEYDMAIQGHVDWFCLDHPEHPFMQYRGVRAKELTSIQKLFIGLPEGNNHCFFNRTDEINRVCPACAAICLFNQASNCPSFGGGFMGSLRGAAPMTTLVSGGHLRDTVWLNIVTRNSIQRLLPTSDLGVPVWIDLIAPGQSVPALKIGLLGGLFWQPAHIELMWESGFSACDFCGSSTSLTTYGFRKEKFTYELLIDSAKWPHPHSPMLWEKKGRVEQKFASFTRTAPGWTQLTTMVIQKGQKELEGSAPAAVVSQYKETFRGKHLNLIVGGYRVKQASVVERRHEQFSLPEGWDENLGQLEGYLEDALTVKDILRKRAFALGKRIGIGGLANQSETLFFNDTEMLVHKALRSLGRDETGKAREVFRNNLIDLARRIFDEMVQSYRHDPKLFKAVITARNSLQKQLNQLRRKT